MSTIDILQHILNDHNRLIQIPVSGDGALLLADTIRDLRQLAEELKNDLNRKTGSSPDQTSEEG